MKYWVFQSNQVIGPFDREVISQVAGFSAESLVCPEGRKGTQMGDWQRAGVVPEMAEALLSASRVPVLSRAGAERGAGLALPPEPTLRDLAVLGSLQERVSQLETNSKKMQDELLARDTEISRLKVELDNKSRSAADMQTKLADLEVKAYGLASIKDELDHAKEEARVSSLQLQDHQRALEDLKERVSRAGTAPAEPAAIPNMAQPAFPAYPMGSPPPGAAESPLGGALESPLSGPRPGSMGRLGDFQPPTDPFAAPAPAPASVKPPEPLGADPFASPSSSLPPADSADEPLVSLGGGLGAPPSGAFSMSPPPLVPVADMAEPSKPRDKRVFIIVGVMVVLMIGAVMMLGGKKKKKKAAGSTPALTAATPGPVAPPQVGEPALDLTQAAVDFVKGYQIPGRQETVAQLLESRYPTTGRLSPWMVEKIENDKYQVNFWATQSESAAGPKPVFQFQVRVKSKLLQGMNPPAMSLLNDGSLPAPESGVGGKRSRRRSADLIGETPAASEPTPARTPRRGRKAAGSSVDAAAAVLEGLKAGTKAAQPPKGKGGAAAKPAQDGPEETQLPPEDPTGGDVQVGGNKGDESDEMLDQLLLPGMDKKTPVKKK